MPRRSNVHWRPSKQTLSAIRTGQTKPYCVTDAGRFDEKVHRTETCWLWTGLLNNKGYPILRFRRGPFYAHRYSYIAHRGAIPDGLVIDHLCRVPRCVNPEHLEPVTVAENNRRAALARKAVAA